MSDYDKRKYLRYPAEPNEIVTVYYQNEGSKTMGQRVGLGENESFRGCCVVFVGSVDFKEGQPVVCESRTLAKVKAQVVWVRKLDDQITKVGFCFTE